jgi:phosphomannomutase
VIDLGLSTTPTVEVAVPLEKAGELFLPLTPKQWNALKLLNEKKFLMVSKEKNPCYR